ncbi:TRAP transporter substrate-binding protein [Cupriavidus pinatubonensis]|uniref:2,3-diketo-L-gulonate-binding periplasmic protein YiaO n=1 Tax=Cupriavidus pinatubonensis TaxID=248026 RepID=A0ABM8XLX3_9BURK|nr:TRAP transporter substrate-binding protein [Cupriavidus pinatubonensis]CAG9181119.1 2,3-diketo-L-gulonate-binding periplasmic protein YiaO [Cupriavidus pinatubonensis]
MINRRQFIQVGAMGALASLVPAVSLGQGKAAQFRFKLGTDLPATHSVNIRLKEAIAAIQTETGGRVAIELFPNNQLGSDSDMLSQIRSGALEMATFPGTVMSTLIPVTALTGAGFLFSGYDKVWAAMDGPVGAHIRAAIEKTNLVPFSTVWDNGFRQITASTKPISSPDDLKNFKIRVPVVPLWVSMFKALGAAPVSLPLSEAYQALQTKVADGQENPLALIESAKFYEVQKYCSLTNHSWDGFWFVANKSVWAGVPADIQQIIAKHVNTAGRKQRDDIARANVDLQKKLQAAGMVFNTVDNKPFREVLRKAGFYAQVKEKFGHEAWSLLQPFTGPIA